MATSRVTNRVLQQPLATFLNLIIAIALLASNIVTAAICSPQFDYDLTSLQLPLSFTSWSPNLEFGNNTLTCNNSDFGLKVQGSIDLARTTVFKWTAPDSGYYQFLSYSPDVSVRFESCARFANLSYSDLCILYSRQAQYFKANASEEFRFVVEGNSNDPDAIVTLDQYAFDDRVCFPAPSQLEKNGLPFCLDFVSPVVAVSLGIITGAATAYFVLPGPVLILVCMILIAGLFPGVIFTLSVAGEAECGNGFAICAEWQGGYYNFITRFQVAIVVEFFFIAFAAVYLVLGMVRILLRKMNVLDVETNAVVSIYSFPLWRACSQNKVIAVSWRWDVDDASKFAESVRLQRCAQYCRSKGFRYMMVDVVTLDQKSVNATAVLAFISNYSRIPVLIGVFEKEEREEYEKRFWTNVEMRKYARNRYVFTLDDSGVPRSSYMNLTDLLCDESISATFELDRLRVLILHAPFGQILCLTSLIAIFQSNSSRTQISKGAVHKLVEFALVLRPLLNIDTFEALTRNARLMLPISMSFWFASLFLPPTPSFCCNPRARLWNKQYLVFAYLLQAAICGLSAWPYAAGCTRLDKSYAYECSYLWFPLMICGCCFSGVITRLVVVLVLNLQLTSRINTARRHATLDGMGTNKVIDAVLVVDKDVDA